MYLVDGSDDIRGKKKKTLMVPPWFKPIHMIFLFLLFQTAQHCREIAYTYDLSITFIRSQAQGYLTTKT